MALARPLALHCIALHQILVLAFPFNRVFMLAVAVAIINVLAIFFLKKILTILLPPYI
jgi:hypothetical protein